MSSTNSFTALTVALALAGFGVSAQAAPASASIDAPTARVSLTGVDLSSQAGAAIALQRIQRAASAICGGEPSPREMDRTGAYRVCVRQTLNDAVAQLGSPTVSALNDHAASPRG
jgi:UrcA family protein